MQPTSCNRARGMTLIEMVIALSLGILVIGVAVNLFSKGLDATFLVSQRAQMQQDTRAAENIMVKDISLAGSGIQGGLAVASGTGKNPRFGCDQTNCYVGNGAGILFPGNYLYPIIPGPGLGTTINGVKGPTDVITVSYTDTTFLLNCYTVAFNKADGTSVTFTTPNPLPPSCPVAPQPVTDAAVGLKLGDLVLFSNTVNGNQAMAVGEVTTAAGAASPYTVTFSDPDRLYLNQTAATGGDMAQITKGTGTEAYRLFVITYYLDVLPDPAGVGLGTPRLMRQVNGQTPVPVAENVADLRFTYDTYDDSGNLLTDLTDAGASQGVSPNMIRKINIKHMTSRSAMNSKTGYQSLDVQTSVSARNMSFKDRYD